jgi:uncharacterized protein DUF4375
MGGSTMPELKWLESYSGESVDQLLAFEDEYRIDSLVLAFEEALNQKAAGKGRSSLSTEERAILAIEALEREVNNGGYRLFFENSSREFAPIVVQALELIGCARTAEITRRAIGALHLQILTVDAIKAAVDSEEKDGEMNRWDELYYKTGEDIAAKLFAFIKANKKAISL